MSDMAHCEVSLGTQIWHRLDCVLLRLENLSLDGIRLTKQYDEIEQFKQFYIVLAF